MGTILRKGLQILLLIVLLICSFFVLVQLLTPCLSQCCTMIEETKIIAQKLQTMGQTYSLGLLDTLIINLINCSSEDNA